MRSRTLPKPPWLAVYAETISEVVGEPKAALLADLGNVICWRFKGLRRKVRLLTGIRLYLRDWRRDIRFWKDRNVRLRRIRVRDIRHRGSPSYWVPGGGT
jgi:hypothetical protein